MDNFAGTILGDFRILELLGSGGMGVVYKACHKDDSEAISAIKVIRADFASDKGFIERFKKERRLMHSLKHDNIVTGHHFGEAGGVYYLAMEYVEGESLCIRLKRDKHLSVAETFRIAAQLSSALERAHGMGVIHRDIKPDNILLRKSDGAALLTDFGLMKAIGEQNYLNSVSYGRMNSEGVSFDEGRENSEGGSRAHKGVPSPGTRAYMAPEQISSGEISPRTDIYQLGMVMYECLTGELPKFGSQNPSIINSEVSKELDDVILRCLKPNPAERYGSAGELNKALLEVAYQDSASSGKFTRAVLLLCCALAVLLGLHWLLKALQSEKTEQVPVFQASVQPSLKQPENTAQIPLSQPKPTTPAPENPPVPAVNKQEEEAKRKEETLKNISDYINQGNEALKNRDFIQAGKAFQNAVKLGSEAAGQLIMSETIGCIERGNNWMKVGNYKSAAAEFEAAVDLGAGPKAKKLLDEATVKLRTVVNQKAVRQNIVSAVDGAEYREFSSQVSYKIYFREETAIITPNSEKKLDQVAETMGYYPMAKIKLIGYAYSGETNSEIMAQNRVNYVFTRLAGKYKVEQERMDIYTQISDTPKSIVEITMMGKE